ncbi:protein TORNADO 1 [Physcomitrium patens]|uniref:C-terminal of Roc (COR) domain-containing protein n=1 Tax=Physcomitrium patens TaxID=3218 RepID=A0A2K1KVU4_PHYPA|nr:protein TORNADO 1-like [Physcomitrium patens]XP_024370298.1 protein TORNADO 1-like [Physcomitrium patens]XP_024370299.1 protein TORNADO 1-like [Physcomitrium patens]XP_024370300.1 protein TORNADO 1-like [Physcomitrium patens]PNR57891.1 hypothetical protein PHYPA_004885 [Physcomitrium patens]|eukprot:XP_024370297.1 protein TORNADO 1-like [Physcomitrella patens]
MCTPPACGTSMGLSPTTSDGYVLPPPAPTTLSLPPKAQSALAMYNPMPLIEKESGPKPQKYSEVDIDGLLRALKNPPEKIVDLYIHYCPRIKSDSDNCSVSLTLADDKFVRRLLYRFAGPDRSEYTDHQICSRVITALVSSPAVSSVTLEIDYVQSDVIVAELCTALQKNRTLQRLSVYSDNRFQQPLNSECVKHIAEMFLVNTGIRELQLGLVDITLQVADNLALALRRNRFLRGLTLYARIDADALAVLTKPFSGSEPNQTLQKLEIKGFKCLGARGDGQIGNKGAENIANVLCRNSSLEEIALKNCEIDYVGVQALALALMSNKNLKVLDLSYNPVDVEGLKEIVKTITMDPATKEQPNTTFREIIIRHSFISRAGAPILANMLATNNTLVRLDLQFSVRSWQIKDVLALLHSLKRNQSLRFLDLRGCDGVAGEKVLATILDLLVTNPWLEQLGVEGTPLSRKGHDAVIKAQLRRNAEKFMEVFKGMGTVTPTAARVFLCGIPFAGKTTFRKTMVYSNIKRTSSSVRLKTSAACKEAISNSKIFKAGRKESQTVGIEVQVIVEDNVQISIWDLAGHEEFHAFHDLVVPNLSSQGSACTFVLLCDMSVPQGKGGKYELKDEKVVDHELRYWLRFIASNTRQSVHMLPNVTVIFTHSDKFPKTDLIAHFKPQVEKLRVQFSKVINITEFHVADARSRKSIEPVQKAMQKRIVSILDRVPKVFDACSQLQTKLNEWKNQHPDKPLIKWSDFSLLCSKVPALKRLQGQDSKVAEERQKAVARAMHDAGELLFFDGLDFMVVDPNWFCHEIMGRILSLDSTLLVLKHPLIDEHGFTKREHLKKVLEASFCKNKNPLFKGRKVRGVIPEDLVQLMVKLNLCFEQNPGDKTSGIYIPASLSNPSEAAARGERPLSWANGYDQVSDDELLHVGWRLKCENPELTTLTLGFFPRLQVFLQKKFSGVQDARYTIEKNFISFVFSGLEFLIEYNGPEECQVDILVRSSKDTVETWATVEENVLKPTREFCASPTEGCQGVVLIEEIMRPQCVRELWVRKKRTKDQCIGVEDLKLKVMASGKLDYEYIWKKSMAESHGLKANSAEVLLGPAHWEDVLSRFLDTLEKIDSEVSRRRSPDSTGTHSSPLSPLTPPPSRRVGRTVSLLPRPSEMASQLLESRIADRSVEINALQKKLFPSLSRNIDSVIDLPFLLQDGKVPHLVYLSTGGDSVNSERLVTKLTPGSYSRKFHLMCEHRDGIHMIEHQVGGIMRCDEKSVRSVRPHMLWGLKLISMLLRISELAAGGFPTMLTEAERMRLMGIVADDDDNDERPDVTGRLSFTPEEMMAAEDWLIHYMKGKNIPALFGLHKVCYLDNGLPSKHVAWICDKHMHFCLNHGLVDVL